MGRRRQRRRPLRTSPSQLVLGPALVAEDIVDYGVHLMRLERPLNWPERNCVFPRTSLRLFRAPDIAECPPAYYTENKQVPTSIVSAHYNNRVDEPMFNAKFFGLSGHHPLTRRDFEMWYPELLERFLADQHTSTDTPYNDPALAASSSNSSSRTSPTSAMTLSSPQTVPTSPSYTPGSPNRASSTAFGPHNTFVPVVANIRQSDLEGIPIQWSSCVHTFEIVFTIGFHTRLDNVLSSDSPEHYSISSSNKRLNAALLTGVAFHYGLIEKSNTISRFAYNNGLALDKPPSAKNKTFTNKRAVSALVAGLMLILGGKRMMEQDMRRFPKEDVANALREKAAWFAEGSNERPFLEEAATSAENGFTREYTSQEAWGKLFG
ncbi:hypothetical protein NMY22_g16516 [Coprinellus aureogranulatus]|nr:hypothetical protein NMY22_g16516 [Coprinellus aureogranulatus]